MIKNTYGLYDFKQKRILRYYTKNITENIIFNFILGETNQLVGFCIYAGEIGETQNNYLEIHEIEIKRFSRTI